MVSRTSCFMCQITTQCKSSTIQGARLRRKEALVSFSLHGLSLPESPLDFVPHLDCTGGVVIDDGCGLSAAITASTAEVFPATCFGFCKLLGPSSLSSPFVVPSRWRLWRRRWPLKPGLRAHFEIARNLLRRDALRSQALRLILSLSRRTSAGPPDQNCAIAIPNSSAFCLRGLCWARRARSAVCAHYVTREPPVRLVMLAAWGDRSSTLAALPAVTKSQDRLAAQVEERTRRQPAWTTWATGHPTKEFIFRRNSWGFHCPLPARRGDFEKET